MGVRGVTEEIKYIIKRGPSNPVENSHNSLDEMDEYHYEHHKMIFYFKYYIILTYGHDIWYQLLDLKSFRRHYYCNVNIYGDAIFANMVHMLSDYLEIGVPNILADFASYLRTAQNLELHEFAKFD